MILISAASFETAKSADMDPETHAIELYSKCTMEAVDVNENEMVNGRLNGKEVTIKYYT